MCCSVPSWTEFLGSLRCLVPLLTELVGSGQFPLVTEYGQLFPRWSVVSLVLDISCLLLGHSCSPTGLVLFLVEADLCIYTRS